MNNVLTQKEPLLTVGAITAVVSAILVFLREFGVDITEGQQDAIRNLVSVLAPIILALVARQFVFSPDSVEKIQKDAYSAGTPPTEPRPFLPPPADE